MSIISPMIDISIAALCAVVIVYCLDVRLAKKKKRNALVDRLMRVCDRQVR